MEEDIRVRGTTTLIAMARQGMIVAVVVVVVEGSGEIVAEEVVEDEVEVGGHRTTRTTSAERHEADIPQLGRQVEARTELEMYDIGLLDAIKR